MQLISMEVNQMGTADRTQVGGLSAGLNAVCGRRGSGKSSLLAWLRGVIQPQHQSADLRRSYAPNSASPRLPALASGRLTLRLGDAEYQLERHQQSGRTDSKILRRSTNAWSSQDNGSSHHSGYAPKNYEEHWKALPDRLAVGSVADALSPMQREAFDRLAAVPSDSQATFRLWDVARELRLDDVAKPSHMDERSNLLARERELLAQLHPLDGLSVTREGLLARRRQLEADLDRARRQSSGKHYAPSTDEHHRLSDRLSALDRDTQKIRDEIAELDAAVARLRDGQIPALENKQHTYRERLLSLDAQLARWRNTLTEIRAHRERLEAASTDAHLDGQLGEQFAPINQATPRLALRSLEAQIVEARRHFDALVEGVDRYRDQRDDARHELPQTMRLMQRELHEVCQQLSRHESLTTNRAMKDQILQLSRCESEMRLAVERLIAERGELLRTIATACHLSVDQVAVAYSDSCRCADHPHLDSWLTAISSGPADGRIGLNQSQINPLYMDQLTDIENRRSQAMVRLESALRDHQETESRLRRLGVLPLSNGTYDRVEADLLRELDLVNEDILRLETRDRLRVDLTDLRRRLQQLPQDVEDVHSVRGRYLRHLAGLTGMPIDRAGQQAFRDQLYRDAFTPNGYSYARSELNSRYAQGPLTDGSHDAGRYEPVRGHYTAGLDAVGTPDVRLARLEEAALRLAIVDVLAARGHQIPLVLDETLDGLEGPRALTAVRYLAGQADVARQQIIVLTDDKELVDAIKSVRGYVVPIVVSRALQSQSAPADYDVNRQLTAFANDWEADKWQEPEWTPPPVRAQEKKRWVLTERSEIQEVPSIGTISGARLRALGIDRVVDLLDADANWLADSARLPGVSAEVVRAWQNESRLLCGMPQLRPFDARVMAGAGIRDPRQLTEMDPSRLLERVEHFLATERGKSIMRSGSPYELSRLTAWVASANRGATARTPRDGREDTTFDSDTRPRARRPVMHRTEAAHTPLPTYHIVEREEDPQLQAPRADDERTTRRRDSRNEGRNDSRGEPRTRTTRETNGRETNGRETHGRETTGREANGREANGRDSNGRDRLSQASRSTSASAKSSSRGSGDSRVLRFYLELSSPVVDAPSIGASMAESLGQAGVVTVNDLLNCSPEGLAQDLGQPRVTAAIIRAWQEQARLVCRIPNLRGHDAQILVACGVSSPEALCRMEPTALLAQTAAFANSTQGQRVLRGSQAPDLTEVTEWISWASQSRALLAA
ncbi:MAG: DUF4332 domain-containing protein [Pirellulaceae bacterium]|nr:DUF4332 domain-containing protein [Pirellulaceae bacterium]